MSYSGGRILLSSQREGQISRFRPWIMVTAPLAAILFQVYVPLFFPFLAFLEMPLLVVVYFALMRRSQVGGLLFGALVGLAQDSLSKNPLGMFGIVKTLVGYFASSIGMRLDVDNLAMRHAAHIFLLRVPPVLLLGDGARAAGQDAGLRPADNAGDGGPERGCRGGVVSLPRQTPGDRVRRLANPPIFDRIREGEQRPRVFP